MTRAHHVLACVTVVCVWLVASSWLYKSVADVGVELPQRDRLAALAAEADIVILGELRWIGSPPHGETVEHFPTTTGAPIQPAFFALVEAFKGRIGPIVPVGFPMVPGSPYIKAHKGLDRDVFLLGRRFVLFLRPSLVDLRFSDIGSLADPVEAERQLMFEGALSAPKGRRLRYVPVHQTTGVYAASQKDVEELKRIIGISGSR